MVAANPIDLISPHPTKTRRRPNTMGCMQPIFHTTTEHDWRLSDEQARELTAPYRARTELAGLGYTGVSWAAINSLLGDYENKRSQTFE